MKQSFQLGFTHTPILRREAGRKKLVCGFTLIEMLLSFGLFAIFSMATYSFAWNVSELNTRGELARSVSTEARFLSERITSLIRNSDGVASFSENRLELEKSGGSGTTIIISRAGALFVDDGEGEELLSGSGVFVRNIAFEDYRSESGLSESIGFSMTLDALIGAAPESAFRSSIAVRGTAGVRSFSL